LKEFSSTHKTLREALVLEKVEEPKPPVPPVELLKGAKKKPVKLEYKYVILCISAVFCDLIL
jgi:hypothetical protein